MTGSNAPRWKCRKSTDWFLFGFNADKITYSNVSGMAAHPE